MATTSRKGGKLRIGDSWNAITIIALSQNNPLKAIAEFVENSIDAQSKHITIVRGREKNAPFLKITDDGTGIPIDKEGRPDFKYVATHICDSIKKRLKQKGVQGIQGEFGIGLLSFWTVGERLLMCSSGADGKVYQMEMKKNEPGYAISQRRLLFSHPGTEIVIHPLLPGLRQLTGEKIQSYLASELRDRIRKSGVRINIKDRYSRKELEVQPRQFSGELLHDFKSIPTEMGEIYVELYLNSVAAENEISLYRSGTRVFPSISILDQFKNDPWCSGYFQGMIDAPFLQLTPGTRDGVIRDELYSVFCDAMEDVEASLAVIVERERKAQDEEASRNILRTVKKALREALLSLPPEEYSWFDIHARSNKSKTKRPEGSIFALNGREAAEQNVDDFSTRMEEASTIKANESKPFFEYAGPLYSALVSPASVIMRVNETRDFRCIARDRERRTIDENFDVSWNIREGDGSLSNRNGEFATFHSGAEAGIAIIQAVVVQNEKVCYSDGIITIAETFLNKEDQKSGSESAKGLPGYTFKRALGELWRSQYDEKNNLIIINNGHRDYLFASEKKTRKLKYICKLYAKELVLMNFPGYDSNKLMDRMIELSLHTEENL